MKYTPTAKVFTLEIDGMPAVSFEALNSREANELAKEAWLREDLSELKSGGQNLWDGTALLRARPASEDEAERYHAIAAEADEEAGDIVLAFLVTLDGVPE